MKLKPSEMSPRKRGQRVETAVSKIEQSKKSEETSSKTNGSNEKASKLMSRTLKGKKSIMSLFSFKNKDDMPPLPKNSMPSLAQAAKEVDCGLQPDFSMGAYLPVPLITHARNPSMHSISESVSAGSESTIRIGRDEARENTQSTYTPAISDCAGSDGIIARPTIADVPETPILYANRYNNLPNLSREVTRINLERNNSWTPRGLNVSSRFTETAGAIGNLPLASQSFPNARSSPLPFSPVPMTPTRPDSPSSDYSNHTSLIPVDDMGIGSSTPSPLVTTEPTTPVTPTSGQKSTRSAAGSQNLSTSFSSTLSSQSHNTSFDSAFGRRQGHGDSFNTSISSQSTATLDYEIERAGAVERRRRGLRTGAFSENKVISSIFT